MALIAYAGAKRKIAPSQLASLERRGFVAQEKQDGCYVELHVGPLLPGMRGGGGRVALGVYRSGRLIGKDSGRDVLGRRVPWPPGCVVAGELMTSTPAAHLWQDRHEGLRGVVLFDAVRLGSWPLYASSRAMGTSGAPYRDLTARPYRERYGELERLVGQLEGPAARALHLAPTWRSRLRERYDELVGEGAEGLIVRDPDAPVGVGALKCKRSDTLTARVVALLPDERVVRLDWGGLAFGVNMPGFGLTPGDLVDVLARGFNEGGIPRHAAIVRVRRDLALS